MDRLTRPEVMVDQTAARFMGEEVKIQDISDKLLHLILNGPTINSINKDTLRHLIRQLYEALHRYEELDMTPEDIEHTLTNFSSFLMEMTGGRMSKTNYTVQAMVSEANNHFESVCDECSDRQELAAYEKTGLSPEQIEAMKQELIDERYRHDRLQDFEVAESQELAEVKKELEKVKAERDAAMADMRAFAEDVARQFGYHTQYNGRLTLTHGGLSTLEWAFQILGWENPHPDPENECQFEGCHHYALCGTPTNGGYLRVCADHFAVLRNGVKTALSIKSATDKNVGSKEED